MNAVSPLKMQESFANRVLSAMPAPASGTSSFRPDAELSLQQFSLEEAVVHCNRNGQYFYDASNCRRRAAALSHGLIDAAWSDAMRIGTRCTTVFR